MQHVSEFRVRYAETDQMGVVYHSNYLIWCEIGRTDFIRALGISYAELERQGVALAVVEAHLRYVSPARYDDVVRVTTTVGELRSRVVRFEYSIALTDATVLAKGYTTLVALAGEGRTGAIPAPLREALASALDASVSR